MAKKRRQIRTIDEALVALNAAIAKLDDDSDTQLKRRNARRKFAEAMKALDVCVLNEFPPLLKDGTPKQQRKTTGAYCGICHQPQRSNAHLVEHIASKHPDCITQDGIVTAANSAQKDRRAFKCCCGFRAQRRQVAMHLAGMPDIVTHFAEAKLKACAP